MTDPAPAAEEPSIEEILASIRKIISDEPGAEGAETAAAPSEIPDMPPPPAPAAEEDVLDLGAFEESTPTPAAESSFDLDMEDSHNAETMTQDADIDSMLAAAAVAPTPPTAATPAETLVSPVVADVATAAFAKINQAADAEFTPSAQLWVGARTIEQVVEDLMRPMLKTWLDQNLSKLVERLVEKELARMARRAVE